MLNCLRYASQSSRTSHYGWSASKKPTTGRNRFASSVAPKSKTILHCKRGHQHELANDLRLANHTDHIHCSVHPTWAEVSAPRPILESSWAVQIMPDINNVSSSSESELADQASRLILSRLQPLLESSNSDSSVQPLWSLHSLPSTGMPWQSKIKPLEKRLLASLSTKSLTKRSRKSDNMKGKPGDVLVQCFMKEASTVSISITALSKTAFFWNRPVPWLGGYIAIPEDKKYPAESYKKCKEILYHMCIDQRNGLEGKNVVELGAMPGGWTMVLLEAGATLTSVDWAQLENPWLTSHPNLTHRCEDARIFDPAASGVLAPLPHARIDYLFADLALPPEKSLLVLETWLQNKWTKAFAWTFKFGFHTGDKYHDMVHAVRTALLAHGDDLQFSLRHLYKHENEMVVLGGWKSMVQEG